MNVEAWFVAPALALVAGVLALAPLGRQVLRRGVVFIDLAVAQAAAAAALAATAYVDHAHGFFTPVAAAVGALVSAAMVAMLSRRWPGQREALIGLVYIASACIALLIARRHPHGGEQLNALLAADVLWAGWLQVGALAACAAAVLATIRKLAHDAWFFVTFAFVASVAVQVLGLFVVFAALIAPALWYRDGQSYLRAMAGAVAAVLAGLAMSWILDAPSGVMVALLLALYGVSSVMIRRNEVTERSLAP